MHPHPPPPHHHHPLPPDHNQQRSSPDDHHPDEHQSDDHHSLVQAAAHPPPSLFLAAHEILGPQLSNRLVLMAWDAVVERERQKLGLANLNDQNALVQDTLSYLIDHPDLCPRPASPPALAVASGSRHHIQAPPARPVAHLLPRAAARIHHPVLPPITSTPHPPLPADPAVLRRAHKRHLEDHRANRIGNQNHIMAASGKRENPVDVDIHAGKRFRADAQADNPHVQVQGPSNPNTPAEAEAEPDANPAPPHAEALAQILTIVPDVAPEHAATLYSQLPAEHVQEARVNMVVNQLLESASYPKSAPRHNASNGKGKGRQTTPISSTDESFQIGLARWATTNRKPDGMQAHSEILVGILSNAYRLLPMDHIRQVVREKAFLVPCWIALDADLKKPETERTFRILKAKRPAKTGMVLPPAGHPLYGEFRDEYHWLRQHRHILKTCQDHHDEEQLLEEQERQEGLLIECQCCYDTIRFIKMIQCPDGHLFCAKCIKQCVEVQIGLNQAKIQCMDGTGCDEQFTRSELGKVLSVRLLEKLEQIEFEQSLDSAMIDGLEKCPFCPWAVIIENPTERLFRCCNEECSKVSCRLCKKPDHIPKTCEEARLEEEKENSLHHVAEAMTEALIRRCPKCQRRFVKEDGCNKIRCIYCGTTSCYICQQVVTGYEHFANAGSNLRGAEPNALATCPLWDDTATRHHEEISKAHQAAASQLLEQNEHITPDDVARFGPGQRPPARPQHSVTGIPPEYLVGLGLGLR